MAKLLDSQPAPDSGDYQVKATRVVAPGFEGVYVQVLDENDNLVGSPLRLFDPDTTDDRIKGDTPGVDSTHFHVNEANQVELVGRS